MIIAVALLLCVSPSHAQQAPPCEFSSPTLALQDLPELEPTSLLTLASATRPTHRPTGPARSRAPPHAS